MSYTIYTATNSWIPQGDRITRTFESGLVLLQQNYIAPTGTPPSPSLELGQAFPGNTSPCIDGAYIFPAPGYQDNNNGFTTCTVTAYGRWRTEPYTLREKQILGVGFQIDFYDTIQAEPSSQAVTFRSATVTEIIADSVTQKFVLPKNSPLPLSLDDSYLKLFKINGEILPINLDIFSVQELFGGTFKATYTNTDATYQQFYDVTSESFQSGFNYLGGSYDATERVDLHLKLSNCKSTDFGHWEEHSATFEVIGSPFTAQVINTINPFGLPGISIADPVTLISLGNFAKI